MRSLLTGIITFILICAGTTAGASDFNLNSRRISVQDGLSGNTINELVQDGQGYIWMATNNGLSRYDGYAAVNYHSLSPNPNERIGARIGRISYDPAGLLWLSTATYTNACYHLATGQFVDWTGKNDHDRQLNKMLLSPTRGMFFYSKGFGVRHSHYADGQFSVTDYTWQGGQLPSDNVELLIEDSLHNIWIATDNGVVMLNPQDQPKTLLQGHAVIGAGTSQQATYFIDRQGLAFAFDAQGRQLYQSQLPTIIGRPGKVNTSFVWQDRWMLFTPQGTYAMHIKDGTWTKEQGERNVVDGLNQGACPGYHFIANSSGRLWIYPEKGSLRTLDLLPKARFTINRGRKFHIVDDQEGRLFIATYGNGLFVWNPEDNHLRHFTAEDANPIIHTNYLLYAIRDKQGCIWLGSEATGAYCLSIMTASSVNYILPEPDRHVDWSNAISCVAQHPQTHHIIIGTREGGIYQYDHTTGVTQKTGTHQNSISFVFTDSQQHEWVGTNGEGLFVDGRQYCKDDTVFHLPENKILDICEDRQGRIWIATRDGGLLLASPPSIHNSCVPPVASDQRSSAQFSIPRSTFGRSQGENFPLRFEQFLTGSLNESRTKNMQLTPGGLMWIATNNGIYSVDTRERHISNGSFRCYNTANGQFPYDEIFTLFYASADSTLWVGAAGSGAIRCRIDAKGQLHYVEEITTRQGLASDNVYSICQDRYGYVWATTENGISRINTHNSMVNTYQPSPVLQGNVGTENCALQTHDGLLLFGTSYGLVTITPSPSGRQSAPLQATITDVLVNGQSMIASNMPRPSALKFPHDQNTLSFRFSCFRYDKVQSQLFQYYLEGVDHDWLPMTTAHHADYTLLPPGSYVFHVRALGNNNEWEPEAVLAVTIRHPWYATWWAWIIWIFLAALFAWYVWSNWKEKFDLHQQMKLQRQLMDFRAQLFTNITHEFRTPLAIIKGAIDKITTPDRQALQTARRGTSRLLKLVNQFMEFRKATTGNLRLQVSEGDLVAFVRDICQDFWPMAQQKDIQLTFTPFAKTHPLPFDHQMVETIVYNLLSNAVKYTPERGSIEVRVREGQVEVADSGPGISDERQKAMFEPFMRGLASQGGMGIGLYTAHEMATIHHGQLTYERRTDPSGSRFTLTLPVGYDYSADELSTEPATPDKDQGQAEAEALIRQMQSEALNDVTVAVIEDDPDMMEQLRQELGIYFHVTGHTNGQAGFQAVTQQPPSLLVCDVMLPDMDGYQIVSNLRRQSATASLPIIMLTALDDETHQLKAYRAGADDYLVKPCNMRLLVAKAMQLMKWRYRNELSGECINSQFIETQADRVFRDKLAMLIAQNLNKPDFSVDRLAELMSMGRTKFYGKVKELTGMSPNKYLMTERMKKAADLLADGELNVAEVSYRVGIQDPSYFNRCFKAHFGVTPSKYVKPAT